MTVLFFLLMVTAVAVFGFRSLRLSLISYVAQTALLVTLFFVMSASYEATALRHWAVVAFLVKVVVVPAVIFFTIKKLGVVHEVEPVGGFLLSPLIGVAVSLAAAAALSPVLEQTGIVKFGFGFFVSIFLFMMGICAFMLRNSFVKHILAYCLFENGIHLTLAASAYNAHALVELGILTDAVFAVIIMSLLAVRYFKAYGTLDVSVATNLKG